MFDVTNWYWIIAGDTSRVWSSDANKYVISDDPSYLAWVAAGHSPTKINVESDLWPTINAPLYDQISALEDQGEARRAMRAVAIGNGNVSYPRGTTTTTALAYLQNLETQIAALRAQLKK